MDNIKIDNSLASAVKSGRWGNPGSKFYNKLMECGNYKALINEAYLLHGDVYKDTTFAGSKCKYPHHVISNGKLVVSIPGIKAAYSRAKQMGVFTGKLKSHLEKHYREMGIYKDSTMDHDNVMKENFEYIENTINGILGTHLYEEDTALYDSSETDDMILNESYEYDETNIDELVEWVDRFVHDDNFRESIECYDEVSHSNLKYDYRFAEDISTGHKLKIVYLISNDMNLENNYELRDDGKYSIKVGKEGIRDMKKNGSTDHESSGQKVIAIIDTATGDKLSEAKTRGLFTGISGYTDENPQIVRVGEIDKMPSFKSTFMGHGRNDKEDIVARERTPHMRGMKGRHMDPGDKLYDQRYVDRYVANEERKRKEENRNAAH